MKSYTDIEQSKKLAEILPPGSSDMYYHNRVDIPDNFPLPIEWKRDLPLLSQEIPCWSLSALLELLDYPQLSKDKLGNEKVGWMVSVYPDNCRYDSRWCDNSIDACYEMIIKLHEQELL